LHFCPLPFIVLQILILNRVVSGMRAAMGGSGGFGLGFGANPTYLPHRSKACDSSCALFRFVQDGGWLPFQP
jgi:hypothetical protein